MIGITAINNIRLPSQLPRANSIRTYLLALALLVPATAQAVSYKSEAGVGIQYAGFAGYQGTLKLKRNSLLFSVGTGISLGYEFAANEKITVGAQVLSFGFSSAKSAHVNYHFSSVHTHGWTIGLDLIEISGHNSDGETSKGAFISGGFRF